MTAKKSDPKRNELCLFVYGTLLRSANHPLGEVLRRGARLIGNGSIRARLYFIPDPQDSSNAYPGAIPSGNPADRVHGELYALIADPERLLATLDEFEHCSSDRPEPHEFLRRRIEVNMADGTSIQAVTYLYCWDVSRARPIPGGRFDEDGSSIR